MLPPRVTSRGVAKVGCKPQLRQLALGHHWVPKAAQHPGRLPRVLPRHLAVIPGQAGECGVTKHAASPTHPSYDKGVSSLPQMATCDGLSVVAGPQQMAMCRELQHCASCLSRAATGAFLP